MSAGADTTISPMERAMRNSPSAFFRNAIGRPVVVRLTTGADYHGILAVVDGYLNIALEQTEEYVNGKLKARYGDAFIRGNNGLFFCAASLCVFLKLFVFFLHVFVFVFDSALHQHNTPESVKATTVIVVHIRYGGIELKSFCVLCCKIQPTIPLFNPFLFAFSKKPLPTLSCFL